MMILLCTKMESQIFPVTQFSSRGFMKSYCEIPATCLQFYLDKLFKINYLKQRWLLQFADILKLNKKKVRNQDSKQSYREEVQIQQDKRYILYMLWSEIFKLTCYIFQVARKITSLYFL